MSHHFFFGSFTPSLIDGNFHPISPPFIYLLVLADNDHDDDGDEEEEEKEMRKKQEREEVRK